MSKIDISREKIVEILESKRPKSLTEVYRLLGGQGQKLSGSVAGKMRSLVDGIDALVANNKAGAGTVKSAPVQTTGEEKFRISKKSGKKSVSKNKIPRHPKNPFRPGSGYGLLLDIIAEAGAKGIGKEDLLKQYCKISGKDLTHAKYDLSVINSSEKGRNLHRSMKETVTIIREGDNYQVRFD